MKKIYVVMIIMLLFLFSGCVNDLYVHEWVDRNGIPHKLTLKTDRGMTSTETSDVFIYLTDGTVFMAGKWELISDPNSGPAIGEMISNGCGGGLLKFFIPGL